MAALEAEGVGDGGEERVVEGVRMSALDGGSRASGVVNAEPEPPRVDDVEREIPT
jgi:hypothetical protein